MIMLLINNLNHSFGEKKIFEKAEIYINNKEMIWIKGENGSGKTTFYKILAGLLKPDEIEIVLNGESVAQDILKLMVNYIPNKPYLFEYLSGKDNMEYLISLFEMQNKYEQILENIEHLDLIEDINSMVYTYSLGMKAKLYLCIMLERETSIILIDELLNNIDEYSLRKVNKILMEKLEGECSIMFSSHTQLMDNLHGIKEVYLKNGGFEII